MYKLKYFLLVSCCVMLIGCSGDNYNQDSKDNYSENDYGTDFESTWGDLIEANDGELVYGTLTSSQQDLVNYPYLDEDCVFFVPNGSDYHSVDWCYTLSRSSNIISCTLQEAMDNDLDSCSKCVGY